MKPITTAFMAALILSASPVLAKSYSSDVAEEREELRESQRMLDKDNADIRHRQQQLEQNRAEKARAKAEGNYGRQAKESLAIGANKAAIEGNKIERYVDKKMIEEDREDLREAREDNYRGNDRSAREMSPSAGRESTFLGMRSTNKYPSNFNANSSISKQEANLQYWQGKRYNSNR